MFERFIIQNKQRHEDNSEEHAHGENEERAGVYRRKAFRRGKGRRAHNEYNAAGRQADDELGYVKVDREDFLKEPIGRLKGKRIEFGSPPLQYGPNDYQHSDTDGGASQRSCIHTSIIIPSAVWVFTK